MNQINIHPSYKIEEALETLEVIHVLISHPDPEIRNLMNKQIIAQIQSVEALLIESLNEICQA